MNFATEYTRKLYLKYKRNEIKYQSKEHLDFIPQLKVKIPEPTILKEEPLKVKMPPKHQKKIRLKLPNPNGGNQWVLSSQVIREGLLTIVIDAMRKHHTSITYILGEISNSKCVIHAITKS